MSISNFCCLAAWSAVLLTSISACGGSQIPSGASHAAGQTRGGSGASSGDLLYLSGYTDSSGYKTYILTYPKGQVVGTIEGAVGLCSDGNGDVYVLSRNAAIEYAHGGTTPLKTLRIPGAEMSDCSVDPSTGNVALTYACPPCGTNLAIFPGGSGTATRYSVPYAETCSYDDHGDLFAGGGSDSAISELPAGSGTFTAITLNKTLQVAGKVQWDGKYVTLQDREPPVVIYRIQVSGSSGTNCGPDKARPVHEL